MIHITTLRSQMPSGVRVAKKETKSLRAGLLSFDEVPQSRLVDIEGPTVIASGA